MIDALLRGRQGLASLAALAALAAAVAAALALACGGGSSSPSDGGAVQATSVDAGSGGVDGGGGAAGDAGAGDAGSTSGPGDGGGGEEIDGGAADAGSADGGGGGGPADAGTPTDGGSAADGGSATDGGGAASACDGLVPVALASPVEVAVDGATYCYGATSHPSGVVAAGYLTLTAPAAQLFSAAGAAQGPPLTDLALYVPSGGEFDPSFHPVTGGFRALALLRPTPTTTDPRVRTYDLRGALVGDLAAEARSMAPLPGGGSAVLVSGATPNTATVTYLDALGAGTGSFPVDGDAGRVLVNWDTGHVFAFVGGLSSRPAQGRWYDGAGAPLTPWFPLGIDKGSGFYQRLLADGVIALAAGAGGWATAVQDGVATTVPVPAWLAARGSVRLFTVRGGRGFAVVPSTGVGPVEIVATSGESCGRFSPPLPGAALGAQPSYPPPRLDVGWDGTLLESVLVQPAGSTSPDRCVFRWWPGLLR